MEWGRGRLFDQDAAQLFQVLVKEARSMRCTGVTTKEERRQRPHGKGLHFHAVLKHVPSSAAKDVCGCECHAQSDAIPGAHPTG